MGTAASILCTIEQDTIHTRTYTFEYRKYAHNSNKKTRGFSLKFYSRLF